MFQSNKKIHFWTCLYSGKCIFQLPVIFHSVCVTFECTRNYVKGWRCTAVDVRQLSLMQLFPKVCGSGVTADLRYAIMPQLLFESDCAYERQVWETRPAARMRQPCQSITALIWNYTRAAIFHARLRWFKGLRHIAWLRYRREISIKRGLTSAINPWESLS